MNSIHSLRPLHYRTVWISDIHLGSRACCADYLLDFLESIECDTLYLVGDIIDLWAMQRSMYWPQSHNDVVRAILKKGQQGSRVIYIPGNHDALLRDHEGLSFGNVTIQNSALHRTVDGKRLLVVHGDEFDNVAKCSALDKWLGDGAYNVLMWLNRKVNKTRRRLGLPYWSLAAYLKHRVKSAAAFMKRFEKLVMLEAKHRGVDGLVCGHLHRAQISETNGILYCNDGDWVESCTALVESHSGTIELLHWADEKHTIKTAHGGLATTTQAA